MSMERRHITLNAARTTISMEPDYWKAIETLSGGDWRQWLTHTLAGKPATQGRSSWLRCKVLAELQQTGHWPRLRQII